MSAETPLQFHMFSGELVGTRNASQKARDRERAKPQQTEMFSQHEIAQFGVRAHPQMSLSEETKLELISEDPRTPEEIEQDRQRTAESLALRLFASDEQAQEDITSSTPQEHQRVGELPPLIVGYRFRPDVIMASMISEHLYLDWTMSYRKTAHSVYDLKCHLVWVTKYRKPVLRGEIALRVRELIRQSCASDRLSAQQSHTYGRPRRRWCRSPLP